MNKPSLQGQVALVTGGAKGFGQGIAIALRAAGARVFITGRDQKALDAAADEFNVTSIRADATSPADWDRALKTVLSAAGRIDILVNNAGGGGKIAATEDQSDDSIASCISQNLTGVIYGCRRIAPLLRAQGSGTIINVSSICAHHAWPTWGIYSAAKAGLNQFSKSLYLELRPHGVRVTTFTPSWGVTDFTDAAGLQPRDPETLAKCIKPSELGQMVAEICSLPPHLCVQETILWPTVQEVSPL
jgi:NAD(P)-dependent dehydrogenase (short-subunit alcohol dehydrogenase family)